MPPLRMMFVGKHHDVGLRGTWRATAEAIGRAAARRGAHFIVGSDSEGTLETAVMSGAAGVAKEVPITWEIHEPHDGVARWKHYPAGLPQPVRVTYPRGDRRWEFPHLSALSRADVVVAMGGRTNTRAVCLAAIGRGVPCVAIPWFGGAGAEFSPQSKSGHTPDGATRAQKTLGKKVPAAPPRDEEGFFRRLFDGLTSFFTRRHTYFISYARNADWDEANHVELVLRRAGRGVLRDETAIRPGMQLKGEIEQLIWSADDFVVVDSTVASSRPWVIHEVEFALRSKRQRGNPHRVVAIMLEKGLPKTPVDPDDTHLPGDSRQARELSLKLLMSHER